MCPACVCATVRGWLTWCSPFHDLKTVTNRGPTDCTATVVLSCCSNAGKFTSRGVVAVDVTVVTRDGEQFLSITVSNTQCGKPLTDPEALFIPFKGTFEGKSGTPSVAAGGSGYDHPRSSPRGADTMVAMACRSRMLPELHLDVVTVTLQRVGNPFTRLRRT